ncbi:hypothetical protein FJ941_28830, partial [Mesorhizobium sp. B2-3-13]|uniref:Ig-like domain-containing protein n=1 Tax=Mesorhizobium sp. B2-3-13 TaxID=2589951 RepID=UPI001168EAF4
MANKLPKADKITVNGLEDHLSTIVLSGSDPDGSVTGYSVSSLPSNGTLYLDAAHTTLAAINTVYASKTFYFLPGLNFNGAASFNYNVVDNKGGISSSSASVTINVAAVNDAPILDLNGAAGGTSTTLSYSPGGSAARIAPSATVADIDSSKFGGGSLRVSITQNKAVSDQITISTDASVTISNGSVFVAGIKVGTVSGGSNGSDLVVSLVSGATPSSVSVLLEHISYSNSLGSPPTSARTVAFTLVDGGGTANGGTDTGLATATINVGAGNHAPTGAVSVAGVATEDHVLTASNTLADADGLGTISYQWQRNSGSGFTNIGGATNTTYTLGDTDVGATVRVVASYTDGHGMAEAVPSAATAAIANVNDAPTGSVTVAGGATEDQVLTASNTLADADGLGTISYQWQRDTSTGFANIGGATNTTYTLGDADVGATLRVVATYTDGHGTPESVASAATAAIANVNDAPTGSVTVAGVATEDQVLTASNTLADADGLGTISYQWQRHTGSSFVDIGGATNTTYTLGDADVGATIRVVASYTDGHGKAESLSSAATEVVASVQDGYVIDGYISGATVFADANGNGQFDAGEYSAVTDNFGHFVLQGGSGDLVVVGGTDTSTDQALIGKLTAPSGSAVVTPLTTLITLLVNDPASNLDVADAEALVRGALGLAPGSDLLTLDPVTAAFQNNADTFLAGISVLNTVSMVAAAIAGAGGDQDAAASNVFSAIANQILGLGAGEILDLTSSSTIDAIADGAATVALDTDLLQALEEVVVASNQTLADDAATASTPAQLVTNATATAFVAQGRASDALATAADDPGQIGTVVNSYTGVGLDAAVSSALNQIGNIAPVVQAHATLTEGADNLEPSILNTRVISTAPSLNPTDSIDLGGGYDVLALFGN